MREEAASVHSQRSPTGKHAGWPQLLSFCVLSDPLFASQVIGSAGDLPSGSTVILEYGEELPSIDKKKVAVGKKVSKDDCCVC